MFNFFPSVAASFISVIIALELKISQWVWLFIFSYIWKMVVLLKFSSGAVRVLSFVFLRMSSSEGTDRWWPRIKSTFRAKWIKPPRRKKTHISILSTKSEKLTHFLLRNKNFRARAAVKDHISLIQGTFLTGKYRDGLRSSYRNFADCDKVFTRLENRTNRLQRNLKASEKQEKIICSGLSAVPTIQVLDFLTV